jgi:hypothetical protein
LLDHVIVTKSAYKAIKWVIRCCILTRLATTASRK